MDRTRIVHYRHSRTPVILSPTSPNPRRLLSSSSSMSSLVSGIDDEDNDDNDKAPLASIDIDFPSSTSRRSSTKSSGDRDQYGGRSSSTGRLIDDSQIGTSVYTALRCQDLPVPSATDDVVVVDMRTHHKHISSNGSTTTTTTRPQRSRSDVTPPFGNVGNFGNSQSSPNTSLDAEAMRRHTLGSWSRSRRKPQQQNGSLNSSSSSSINSSTLPHNRGVSDSPSSSDTLVKSRRRYTWLTSNSKQTSPQGSGGSGVSRPQNLDVVSDFTPAHTSSHNTSNKSSTLPRGPPAIKSPLSPLIIQQNGVKGHHSSSFDSNSTTTTTSFEVSTFPRASTAKANSNLSDHNKSMDTTHHREAAQHSSSSNGIAGGSPRMGNNVHRHTDPNTVSFSSKTPTVTSPSPKTSPSIRNSREQQQRENHDNGLVSTGTTENSVNNNNNNNNSPKTEDIIETGGSPISGYNWRRDPRRRPCNFVADDFSLSPPQSPSDPDPGTRDPPPSINKCAAEHSNSNPRDYDYSPSPTKKQQHNNNYGMAMPSPPHTRRTGAETSFSSKISTFFGSEKCNSKSSNSSESSANSYVSYGGPDNDLAFEDKTPVNELEPSPFSQCLEDASRENNDDFTFTTTSSSSPLEDDQSDKTTNLRGGVAATQSSHTPPPPTKHDVSHSDDRGVGYRDCWVRHSLQFAPNGKSVEANETHHHYEKSNSFKQGHRKFCYTKKSNSVSVCSGGTGALVDKNSVEHILTSPRTRNSFKIAVGSSWDDVFPAAESLSRLPDISEDKTLSPKRQQAARGKIDSEEDVFVSCSNVNGGRIPSDVTKSMTSDIANGQYSSSPYQKKTIPLAHSTLIQEGQPCEDYDSLTRRIKRNSMRLATASLSDITCAIDDIDINNSNDTSIDTDTSFAAHLDSSSKQDEISDNNKTQTSFNASPSPLTPHTKKNPNLSRTGSLLSSQNGSSFGSFYSCQSIDAANNSQKNSSPKSNASSSSHRKELRSRLDSPLINTRLHHHNHHNSHHTLDLNTSFPSSTRTSSPVSVASSASGRSGKRPAYYWTRQTPYPRLLYARSNSVASSSSISGGSGSGYNNYNSFNYRPASPQPSTTSSIHTNGSHTYTYTKRTTTFSTNIDNTSSRSNSNSKSKSNQQNKNINNFCEDGNHGGQVGTKPNIQSDSNLKSSTNSNTLLLLPRPTNNLTSRPIIDRRSMTLPLSTTTSHHHYSLLSDNYNYNNYTSDLSPSSILESPNSPNNAAVRSPPSLGRPKRKQYAGFDCQPLPMDSFMSDSSSVYTGVSCSSRATDMTGQPDNGHNISLDESFMSEELRSCFEGEGDGVGHDDSCSRLGDVDIDISFDAASETETLQQPSSFLSDVTFSKDMEEEEEENDSKRGSIHSTASTTKQDNNGESSSLEEGEKTSRDGDINNTSSSSNGGSIHGDNSCDDFIEENSSGDHVGIRLEKQFGSEYDALFRLYKQDDMFTMPSYSLYSQNGKAFSSSCLLRAQLYSKRKFLSTRDIFDMIKNSDKSRPDGTVSLTSLERHAHKVCAAILYCDDNIMDRTYISNETHSLV